MKKHLFALTLLIQHLYLFADNQTLTTTPVEIAPTLPFKIEIEKANFELPNGWQTGAFAFWQGKALLIGGRTNGLHGFDNNPNVNNFPPSAQNTTVYVVDFTAEQVFQRSLNDPGSGLSQEQIDYLSVVAPQYFQSGKTLYISGGYGINSLNGTMGTKPVLTAINIPGLVKWVTNPSQKKRAKDYIRQTTHPLLQVTGGYMNRVDAHHPVLLIFGQNFTGLYTSGSSGQYTKQVRSFWILDNGKQLSIAPTAEQGIVRESFRRRDLNVVPILRPGHSAPKMEYLALSGVFTESGGIWNVPVFVSASGETFMPNPDAESTFKQGMNNYFSARTGFYSKKTKDMYIILFGGLTYGYFQNGEFLTDAEIPFTNQVTAIKIDKDNNFTQYLLDAEYPEIISTVVNPGNPLLFGAGAQFVPSEEVVINQSEVIEFDRLSKGTVTLGYILGGIQSTLPNTTSNSDSAASPYIFKVIITNY